MKAGINDNIKIHGKLGVGTAFRLRAKAKDSFKPGEGRETEVSGDIRDEITLIRESLLIGGGVDIGLNGSTTLVVELTFDNGFINVLKGNNTLYPELRHKAVLNFVELSCGIIF
jgi:hypothetical protein